MRTGYSVPANFAVPAGTIRFCRFSAFETSIGDRRFAYSSSRSRSTMTWRFLPPNGYDTVAPCTVASGVRMKLFARSKISCSWSVWLLRPELENRHARRVVLQDLRRKRARRHVADLDLALRHDLRQREIHLHVRMEEHADDRDALVRLRLDVLDADDVRRERALEVRDDAALHLLRRQPVVLPDDADDRNVDVGKDIHRHRRDRDAAREWR